MKVIKRPILPFQENTFFSPIRDKIDYAKLILYAARSLLIDYEVEGLNINSNMKLVVDKMSRLFLYKDRKYFSVAFPFSILTNEVNEIEISTYSGKLVDSKSISAVISIIEDPQFKINPSPIDFYIDSNSGESIGFSLLEEIFQFEPSYIRYDIDKENENGKLHPLHHLDINYSTYGTFKLGLQAVILESHFENILNISTDCSFVVD